MADLPPDLARLGDELTGAARRAAARRERRRRIAVAAAVGAAAFVALTPAALDPAQRTITFADVPARYAPPGCDQPRGARFTMPACDEPMILNRPAAWPNYS
jgi:hypothetical protein